MLRDDLAITYPSNPVSYIQTANNPNWFITSNTNPFGETVVSTNDGQLTTPLDPSAG